MAERSNADDYDRLRRRVLWSLPSGLYVLGSRHGERRNGMTLNWAMQVAIEPKRVAVSILRSAYTHELVEAGGVFSLNVLKRSDRAMVRRFVKPVVVDDRSGLLGGHPFHDGVTGAPVLDEAHAYLDCRVAQQVPVGDHTLFIGDVVDAGFLGEEGAEVLRMEDTRMNYGG